MGQLTTARSSARHAVPSHRRTSARNPESREIDLLTKGHRGSACGGSEILSRRSVQDGAGGADDETGALGGLTVAHGLIDVTSLGSDSGNQEGHVACYLPHFSQLTGIGRADDQEAISTRVPAPSRELGHPLIELA